ncbi:MAG: hypothetical protein QOK28_2190 [Actinomycetota bacterium]|jgi:hypothetical protein
MPTTLEERIARLSTTSARRVIDPDDAVRGHIDAAEAVVAPELLSVAGLGLELSAEQWKTLAREEVASITEAGIRFELLLIAGFARQFAYEPDVTNPRAVYVLHELGEETRHSRLFIRLLDQLAPMAQNPFVSGPLATVDRWVTAFVLRRPLLFYVMVLAGEEVPDLFQQLASEHAGTDPFFRSVNVYHRAEEARHLAYARLRLPELWHGASRLDRFLVRRLAPLALRAVFDSLVHPGVYETVGLRGWKTWRAVRRSASRVEFRGRALHGVLAALVDAGAINANRVPGPWRRLVGQ